MAEIVISVKHIAKNKEALGIIEKPDPATGNTLKIVKEKQPQEPIVSKAPMGPEVLDAAEKLIRQYFTADALINVSLTGIIGNAAYELLKNIVKKSLLFFASNNKQKGNVWGAKLELKKDLGNDRTQTAHFFLDNISEEKMFGALAKVQGRFEHLNDLLGEEYVKQLRHIGFTFDDTKNDWTIIGVEKFDGAAELPVLE